MNCWYLRNVLLVDLAEVGTIVCLGKMCLSLTSNAVQLHQSS